MPLFEKRSQDLSSLRVVDVDLFSIFDFPPKLLYDRTCTTTTPTVLNLISLIFFLRSYFTDETPPTYFYFRLNFTDETPPTYFYFRLYFTSYCANLFYVPTYDEFLRRFFFSLTIFSTHHIFFSRPYFFYFTTRFLRFTILTCCCDLLFIFVSLFCLLPLTIPTFLLYRFILPYPFSQKSLFGNFGISSK
jgi:hypothetical protein